MKQYINLHSKRFELYISGVEIDLHIKRLADAVNGDFRDAGSVPLIVVTLGGGFMFAGELAKHLDFDCEFAFVKCSSYGSDMSSSGCVSFDVELTADPAGRDIIVIEDIVETGNTYGALNRYLYDKGARSVRIATMLLKKDKYKKEMKLDYVGVSVEDRFIIGYGLDYDRLGRNLPGLYILAKEE